MGGFRLPSKKDVRPALPERAPDPDPPPATFAPIPTAVSTSPASPTATMAAFGHFAEEGVGFHGRVTPAPAATILDVQADRHGVRGSFTGENSGSGMHFDSAEEKREIDRYGIRVNNMPFTPEPFATNVDFHANRDGARGGITGQRSGRGLTFDTAATKRAAEDGVTIHGGFTPEPFATNIDFHAGRDGVRGGLTGERSGSGITFDTAEEKREIDKYGIRVNNMPFSPEPFATNVDFHANRDGAHGGITGQRSGRGLTFDTRDARRKAHDAKENGVSVTDVNIGVWPFTTDIDFYANQGGVGGSVRVDDELGVRRRARDAANDAGNAAANAASDAANGANDAANDASAAANSAADGANDAAHDAADAAHDAATDVGDAAADAADRGADAANDAADGAAGAANDAADHAGDAGSHVVNTVSSWRP